MKLFRENLGIVFIIVVSIIPLFDLFHSGLPITHDGQDHVARIANFYDSLSQGNIIPRWAENLNWGYGHPILMFLYPFPSYLSSFFHFLGFSLIDSLKIVFGLTFIASGVAMYLWVKNFLGELPGLSAAILYMFAPYRFVDLYVRGAIGEHVAFVFPPLILFFLLKLSKKYSPWYIVGGSVSLAGLVLSHNAITLMFLPFILLYVVYLIFNSKNPKFMILNSLFIILFGFGISSFFLLPAFMEGKYTLRDIVTNNEYFSRFETLNRLIYSPWNYGGSGQFSVQIGFLHLASVLAFPFVFVKLKRKNERNIILYAIIFAYFLVSIFLMIKQSNFIWQQLSILQKFQFPWRFLSVTVFTTAILGGFLTWILPKRKYFFFGFLFLVFLINRDYWNAKGYLNKPDSFFKDIYNGTTDTGESSPIWSVRFMEKRPIDTIEVVEGEATIKKISRSSTQHRYEIKSNNDSRIRENTLYFPGWKVHVDGEETIPEFQDPRHRGLMTFYLENGVHTIDVEFKETKLRNISNIISAVSLIMLIFLQIIFRKLHAK